MKEIILNPLHFSLPVTLMHDRVNSFLHKVNRRKTGIDHYTVKQESKSKESPVTYKTPQYDLLATNVTVDFSLIHKKVKKVSCKFEGFYDSILLQDTVIKQK